MRLLDGALLLAVLAVAPLAAAIHPGLPARAGRGALLVGVPAAVGIVLPAGPLAAGLGLPLLAWASLATWETVQGWWRGDAHRSATGGGWWGTAPRQPTELALPAGLAYLTVAAAWLLADRLSLEPVGFAAPFVQLTAIHFVYAGLAATTIAVVVRDRAGGRLPRLTTGALAATAAGPPLVAAGFTVARPLLVVGAVALALGLALLAATAEIALAPALPPRPRRLLHVAGAAIVVGMLPAVHWAAATTLGFPRLDVPAMARTHGVINALGFTLPALVALRHPPGRRPRRGPAA